jgi:hypothetical protein
MEKYIDIEEVKNAIQKIEEQAKKEYMTPKNRHTQDHGYGMEYAAVMLGLLLKV